MTCILIIEDNSGVSDALSLLMDLHGYDCLIADNPSDGLSLADEHAVDLIIQDMNFNEDSTSGEDGIRLFRQLREQDPDVPIILLTAWTHLDQAVTLVKAGASDYLQKPWDDHKLITTIETQLELGEHRRRLANSDREQQLRRQELAASFDLCGVIYASDAMHQLLSLATRIARSDVPVLITGPNGCGKQKIAEVIQANSAVADQAFITINAGALPEHLIEAELFGAEAGAYTGATKARTGRFEAADNGTLFLDEIGNLPLDGQKKLLRVLQTGEFERLGSSETRTSRVRLISATNADLDAAVASGQMREDLLYRLNVIQIEIPPLKARPADILPLAQSFLGDAHRFSPDAEAALSQHDWPGNVRELENRISRARLLATGAVIQLADLGFEDLASSDPEHSEQEIRLALDNAQGVIARAARALNLTRQSLYRRMEKLGIDQPE